MKRLSLLALALALLPGWRIQAQSDTLYRMPRTGNDTLAACSILLTDDGGPDSNYSTYCNATLVLMPESDGLAVRLTGTLRACSYPTAPDALTLYEGIGTSGRCLGVYRASATIDTVSTTGPMTLRFVSSDWAADGYYGAECQGFLLRVECEELPSCPRPTDLSVSHITGTAAQVAWASSAEAIDYTLEVYQSDGTFYSTYSAEHSPYTLTGLQPGTDYFVSLSTVCTNSTLSDTSNIAFSTTCLYGGEVLIGEGETYADNEYYAPFACYYPYSYSQMLYPASQLATMGDTIYGIAYYQTNSAFCDRELSVYIDTCSLESFTAVGQFRVQPSARRVYQGTYHFSGNGWQRITFDTPVVYPHGSGLVVTCYDNTGGGYNTTNYPKFRAYTRNGSAIRRSSAASDLSPEVTPTGYTYLYHKQSLTLFLTNCGTATCVAPGLHLDSVGAEEAAIHWTPGYEESLWRIEHKASADTLWTTDEAAWDLTEYTFEGLMPNTAYDLRVTSLCSSTDEASALLSARTACSPVIVPLSENFESFLAPQSFASPTQSCWHRHSTSTNYAYPYVSDAHVFRGNYALYLYGMYHPYLVTPPIENEISDLVLLARVYVPNGTGTLQVGVMTDPDNPATFLMSGSQDFAAGDQWQYAEIPLAPIQGQGHRVALTVPPSTGALYIDNLSILRAPDCARVSNPTVDTLSATASTITLAWTDTNAVGSYTLCWGTGEEQDEATDSITVNSLHHTLTGLVPGTRYYAWIRVNCADEPSWWRPFGDFTTVCTPIQEVPWSEDFSSVSAGELPLCWEAVEEITDMGHYPSVNDGALTLLSYRISGYSGNSTAATPVIGSLMGLQLSFHAYCEADPPAVFSAGAVDSTGVYHPVDTLAVSTTSSLYTLYLDRYAAFGNRVAFRCFGATGEDAVVMLDNLLLDSVEGCPMPSRLTCTATTSTTATLTWVDNGGASQWQIATGTSAEVDSTTAVTVSSTTHTATGLASGQRHYFYVRALCGGGMASPWVGPVTAIPGSLNLEPNSHQSLTLCDAVLFDDGGPAGAYSRNQNTVLTLLPDDPDGAVGLDGTCTIEYYDSLIVYEGAGTEGQMLFVATGNAYLNGGVFSVRSSYGPLTLRLVTDGSDNYAGFEARVTCFDASCPRVTHLEALSVGSSSATLQWTPVGSESEWVVRLGENLYTTTHAAYTFTNLEPEREYTAEVAPVCAPGDTGRYVSLTFFTDTVPVEASHCEVPTALEVQDITDSTARVTWVPGGDETDWSLRYSTAGDTITRQLTSTEYTLTGLAAGTTYSVAVRALCADSVSDWCLPVEFSTLSPIGIPYSLIPIPYSLYPNPATDQLTIEGYEGEVLVFDLQGRLMLREFYREPLPLSLPSGVYFVKLGTSVQRLIVK